MPGGLKNVLLVDDEEGIRFLVKAWLEKKGYEVITAVDGSDCVSKLSKTVDLIFLDIMMPGLTPKEVIAEVKLKASQAVVIYLTAVEAFNLTRDQEMRGLVPVLEPPVIGYIEKPVNEASFLRKFDEILKSLKVYRSNR